MRRAWEVGMATLIRLDPVYTPTGGGMSAPVLRCTAWSWDRTEGRTPRPRHTQRGLDARAAEPEFDFGPERDAYDALCTDAAKQRFAWPDTRE